MILPIVGYGNPILKKRAQKIEKNYPDLKTLISDMFETMYHASGVGLAAPQIGKSIRLFIIDTSVFDSEDFEETSGFKTATLKKIFINPEIIDESGDTKPFEEGCLSIPDISLELERYDKIKVRYYNQEGKAIKKPLSGFISRLFQHELDHLNGKLFIDHLRPMKKMLVKNKMKKSSRKERE